MKIGCCVKNANEASIAQEAGYDFVECSVLSLYPEGEDSVFQTVLDSYKELTIPVEVCNLFLPKDMEVVGYSVDYDRIKNYVESVVQRVSNIGADTIVFGSGYARNFPKDFPQEKAEEQIIEFLNICAEIASKLDVTIVIEPLNKKESNMINSIKEGVHFSQVVNSPSIQVLADFYHMDEEQEALTELVKYSNYLKHIHLADTNRHQPGTGNYPYLEFSNCIKEAGYNKRICIEAIWTNFNSEELKKSLQFLKNKFI